MPTNRPLSALALLACATGAACGSDFDPTTEPSSEVPIRVPVEVDGMEPLIAYAIAPPPPADDVEEPAGDALGFVTIGDETYPITAATAPESPGMGCGPAMLEIESHFVRDGTAQVIHADLSFDWTLPDEPTETETESELLWSATALRCLGECYETETFWLGYGDGRMTVHADDDHVYLEDFELKMTGTDDGVPVKVTLSAATVPNVMGF